MKRKKNVNDEQKTGKEEPKTHCIERKKKKIV